MDDALDPQNDDQRRLTAPEAGLVAHEPATESHDPPVPEAYAAFMRTGWGDRELDLPPHPITQWARHVASG